MATKTDMPRRQLRTITDLMDAGEDLFNRLANGTVDVKTGDALNTVLKGQRYFVAELPMQGLKIYVQSQIKKVEIPEGLMKALPIQLA